MRTTGFRALLGGLFLLSMFAGRAQAGLVCVGDCKSHGAVGLDDVVTSIRIALAEESPTNCQAADANNDGVQVDDLVLVVDNYLNGCEGNRTPLPTRTPTPTGGPPSCPLEPGKYTVTQVDGGELALSTVAPYPFPGGGTIIEELGPGNANCVHSVVVPFPDGFHSPAFCSVAAFSFSTSIAQRGCGIGVIDSNGGSDFTMKEQGDSSAAASCPCDPNVRGCPDTQGECAFGLNNDLRVDVTVGDGTPDTCTGTATANSLVSVPVHTITWQALSDPQGNVPCPDPDGEFNPEIGETLIVEFDQTLDFTTDTTLGEWKDFDSNGCGAAAPGLRGPLTRTGSCLDLGTKQLTTVAAGTIGSNAGPLYDLTFVSVLPSVLSGPEAATGVTCADPPLINFAGGTVTRCVFDCPLGTMGPSCAPRP